jgi:cell division protein FtsA
MKREDLIVGLDIGTTKICCIVGERDPDGDVHIIGVGTASSRGLRKGMVINIESTIESIRRALEEAETMSGREINEVYTGISGAHIYGMTSKGMVVVKGKKEIRREDIERVLESAKAVNIPPDREVLHIIPQEFIVDNQDGIRDPLGMIGVRLEAKVHIITAAVTSAQNLVKCCQGAGLHVSDIVLQHLASAEAVLIPDEKEIGVALVDIGGGTTDIAVFTEGSLKYTSVISIGGNHFTNDIAIGLKTTIPQAESVKKAYGVARASLVTDDEMIEVQGVSIRAPQKIPRKFLARIIEPRAEELLQLIRAELEKSGYLDLLAGGVVFTGGTSQLTGLVEMAEELLRLPCRLGVPRGIRGLTDVVESPQFATGVGLVLYGAKYQGEHRFRIRDQQIFEKVFTRMREWWSDLKSALF